MPKCTKPRHFPPSQNRSCCRFPVKASSKGISRIPASAMQIPPVHPGHHPPLAMPRPAARETCPFARHGMYRLLWIQSIRRHHCGMILLPASPHCRRSAQ
jgi:hypothetical protein